MSTQRDIEAEIYGALTSAAGFLDRAVALARTEGYDAHARQFAKITHEIVELREQYQGKETA